MKGNYIMKIDVCSKKEQDYIIERLVEYNLSQVEAKQKENFIDLSKKIGKDDKIVAGIVVIEGKNLVAYF